MRPPPVFFGDSVTTDLATKRCAVPGCPRYPLFGFGCNLLRGVLGVWACGDHRDQVAAGYDDGKAAAEAATMADQDREGRLL